MQLEPLSAPLITDSDDICSNVVFHFQSSASNGINTLTIYVTKAESTGPSSNPEHGSGVSSQGRSSEVEIASTLSQGGSSQDIPDPSTFGWVGGNSMLNSVFGHSTTSSFQQGSLAHAVNSTMPPHMDTSYPGYTELSQDYQDNTSTSLTNHYPSWTDPAIFSLPFIDPPTSSVPSSASSSLPTTPGVKQIVSGGFLPMSP
ncbi:hypothetical protein F5878DRAFT_667189 [Lentinula raphanica]|uniref:Uncharacterized protein n=1 Tax=Lentinula raphanica TaxID=153919 RepID=A0AA38NW45_9AGAR|nr:hypothetical protein F5878DRAFT_667256 [Lentinula raphanica]KAJ3831797.1 hypothetical protein F5878DRAFT_667189 [Lentinula raphanica]